MYDRMRLVRPSFDDELTGLTIDLDYLRRRNRRFDTALGCFSYRHLPSAVYRFGWTREELPDGAGYLIARPE